MMHDAAERNVIVGLEMYLKAALGTAETAVQLVLEINSPYLHLNFDIRHFDIIGISI